MIRQLCGRRQDESQGQTCLISQGGVESVGDVTWCDTAFNSTSPHIDSYPTSQCLMIWNTLRRIRSGCVTIAGAIGTEQNFKG